MNGYIKLLLPALALFCCTGLLAQKKSLPGFYVSQNGDTIRGLFPAYAQWSRNPSKVDFLPAAAAKPVVLTPQTCQKFVVEGYDEYLSYTGKRLINPIDDAEALKYAGFADEKDSLENINTFLRLVTRTSGAELYSYNDARRSNFYLALPGQAPTELKFKLHFRNQQIVAYPVYQEQLQTSFGNSIAMASQNLTRLLERMTYTEDHLSGFLHDLFPLGNTSKQQRNADDGWVVAAGLSLNQFKVDGDPSSFPVALQYKSSLAPLLSAGYLIPIGRNFGRYFIFPQVKFFRYRNTGERASSAYIRRYTFQSDFVAVLELNGGLNVVNQENFRIFLSAGAGMMRQSNAQELHEALSASDRSPTGIKGKNKLPSLTYAINGSGGITLNRKIFLTATYLIPSPVANYMFYSPELSGIQVRLGYKL